MSGFGERLKRFLGLATAPERAAKAAFARAHPAKRIAWTRLTAEEELRFVVGIYYGDTRPPRYAFYAVNKESGEVRPIDDDSPYRPKVWR